METSSGLCLKAAGDGSSADPTVPEQKPFSLMYQMCVCAAKGLRCGGLRDDPPPPCVYCPLALVCLQDMSESQRRLFSEVNMVTADHCDLLLDAMDKELDQLQIHPRQRLRDSVCRGTVSCGRPQSESQDTGVGSTEGPLCGPDLQGPAETRPDDGVKSRDRFSAVQQSHHEEALWRLRRLLGDSCGNADTGSRLPPSDSICTEEFAQRFRQEMVHEPVPLRPKEACSPKQLAHGGPKALIGHLVPRHKKYLIQGLEKDPPPRARRTRNEKRERAVNGANSTEKRGFKRREPKKQNPPPPPPTPPPPPQRKKATRKENKRRAQRKAAQRQSSGENEERDKRNTKREKREQEKRASEHRRAKTKKRETEKRAPAASGTGPESPAPRDLRREPREKHEAPKTLTHSRRGTAETQRR
uniref:Uncharacterized protein n=1 Tax=Knipowitschia caucasica TaxID=637954 RepID=A0AAV2MT73_KNICA